MGGTWQLVVSVATGQLDAAAFFRLICNTLKDDSERLCDRDMIGYISLLAHSN